MHWTVTVLVAGLMMSTLGLFTWMLGAEVRAHSRFHSRMRCGRSHFRSHVPARILISIRGCAAIAQVRRSCRAAAAKDAARKLSDAAESRAAGATRGRGKRAGRGGGGGSAASVGSGGGEGVTRRAAPAEWEVRPSLQSHVATARGRGAAAAAAAGAMGADAIVFQNPMRRVASS